MRRFGLRSVLILVAVGALFSAWLGYRYEQRPIEWIVYSEEELEGALEKRKLVFLFTDADWDLGPKVLEQTVLDKVTVKRFLRTHQSVVCMRVDMSDSTPRSVPEVLERVGVRDSYWFGSHPSFVIWNEGDDVDILHVASGMQEDEFVRLLEERIQLNASALTGGTGASTTE